MRFELLGVEIAVEGAAAAAAARPLAPLSTRVAPSREPDVVVSASFAAAPRPVPDPPVFVHEPLRAARVGGALLVGDGDAVFAIEPGGRRIDAEIRPEALADGGRALAALHVPVAIAFALRHHGVFHLHAAALADGERAILVAGQSGVGKTTLALALLEAGLAWACDDATFVTRRDGPPRLQGVSRAFHVRPDTLAAFPRIAALAGPPDASGRRDLDPEAAWPGRSRTAPLRPAVLLFPAVSQRASSAVERLSPADALGRLIEASALMVVDGAARPPEHLALLAEVASGTHALRVELGADLLAAPAETARRILAG